MIIEKSSRESRTLNLMRFPLATLIVLLHTASCGHGSDFTSWLAAYVNAPIVQVAVPAFFFMSGYLFFIGKDKFCFKIYEKKIKKKFFTLFVPYLLWNYISLFLQYGYSFFKTGTIDGALPWEIFRILWKYDDGIEALSYLGYTYPVIVSPAAGVLWFMRDLMVMMLCSIVIYPIVKKLKWWIFPILILINVFKIGVPLMGFSLSSITFFSIGAFFSIHEIHIFEWLHNFRKYCFCLWPLLILVQDIAILNGWECYANFRVITLLSGIAFVYVLAYSNVERDHVVNRLFQRWSETSFFIYTFGNTLILWFINKDIGYYLSAIPHIGCLLNYYYLFLAKVLECVFMFYLLKKYFPSILAVLVGGRIKK